MPSKRKRKVTKYEFCIVRRSRAGVHAAGRCFVRNARRSERTKESFVYNRVVQLIETPIAACGCGVSKLQHNESGTLLRRANLGALSS